MDEFRPPAKFLIPDQPIIDSVDKIELEIMRGKGIREVKGLLHKYHYLPRHDLVGRQIYMKVTDGENPIAVLSFSNPIAMSLGARDRWIGWDKEQRLRNLNHKVMHEARFLILPHVKVPNLASQILSKSCKLARQEWKRKYGDNAVLVESFVDARYYIGTCYKAAGFQYLGETKGYSSQRTGKRTSMWAKRLYGDDATRSFDTLKMTGETKFMYYLPLHRYWRRELLK